MNMKRFSSALKAALLLTPVFGLSMVPHQALASTGQFDFKSSCTTENCDATSIDAGYQTARVNGIANVDPFKIQIFSEGNECVRLDVINQSGETAVRDMEMTLISPNGVIWQNDDRTASDKRPLIKAITPNVRGWYVLSISRFDGAPDNGSIRLLYGRYSASNPNCASATSPLSASGGNNVK